MPSSFSASLRFEEQFTGENINLWGVKLNATISRIDDAIAGYVPLAITGNYTLQSANTNASADEARRAHLKFTGTLVTNSTVTIPSVSKSYWIWNATNKTLTFTTGSGNTATVEAGDILPIWCDGTNVKSTTYGGLSLKDYITSFSASAGAVPSPIGNAGKFLYSDGTNVLWRQPQSADIGDFESEVRRLTLVFTLLFGGA